MAQVEVLDNFLSAEDFQQIKSLLLGDTFPWYYNAYQNSESDISKGNLYDFQFTHKFYEDKTPQSTFLPYFEPLISKINPLALVRLKANLTTITKERTVSEFHRDLIAETADIKTAVFYINTNNGATRFETGEEVSSIENRLAVFNSKLNHAAVSTSNSACRIVLNLNYICW